MASAWAKKAVDPAPFVWYELDSVCRRLKTVLGSRERPLVYCVGSEPRLFAANYYGIADL